MGSVGLCQVRKLGRFWSLAQLPCLPVGGKYSEVPLEMSLYLPIISSRLGRVLIGFHEPALPNRESRFLILFVNPTCLEWLWLTS